MIPGLDFRAFRHGARERAQAVYEGLARRYARLALEASARGRVGLASRYVTRALEGGQRERAAPRSFAHLAAPEQPARTLREIEREAALQERKRLAELFKVAIGRAGGVDFALRLLNEGVRCRHIATALQTLPEASRRHGGFAARIAARDALAAVPPREPARNAKVAALIAAYNKVLGRDPAAALDVES